MPSVTVEGAELYYREAGDGPSVLLIHGGTVDSDTWDPIFDDLARDHRVIAYDRRGTTRSRAAGAVGDWRRHGEDAAAILRALDAAPATVVGWSSGAMPATDLTVEHPELVSALVLIEPGLFARKNVTPDLARRFLRFQILALLGRREQAISGFLRWVTSRRDGGSWWDDPTSPPAVREAMLANTDTFLVEVKAKDDYLLARVGDISVPVRVIAGDRSPRWYEKAARSTADRIPGAQFELVPGMSHAVATDAPQRVAEIIRSTAN